jgi:hypothetical protein
MEAEARWLLGGVEANVPAAAVRPDGAPQTFTVSGKNYRVYGVADHWPDVDFDHYKVRTDGGYVFLLHHHLGSDTWLAQFLEVSDT